MPLILRVGTQVFRLEEGRSYVLGSAEGVDLRVNHGSIDGHHATLTLDGTTLRVEDMRSVAGLWSGNERADSLELNLGSAFRAGDIELRYEQQIPDLATPAAPPVGAGTSAASRLQEPSFHELMADQLRRAPWFAISLVLHVLLFFIAQLFFKFEDPDDGLGRIVSIQEGRDDSEEIVDELEEETIEVEEIEDEVVLDDPSELSDFDEPDASAQAFDPSDLMDSNPFGADLLTNLRAGGKGEVLDAIGSGLATEKFRKTVTSMRRSGLDIVFVFDSTQSMEEVLDETKRRIATMVDVLHALVNNSRIGIVTYRDHGKHEQYLARQIPLDDDYYRAVNFMQSVYANGGGDIPEAVYDAVRLAVRQKWRKGSKRMIVLIGDAPAHKKEFSKLRSMVRDFARHKNASIHTIMTERNADGIDPRCREHFEALADAGKGACIPLENEQQILKEVLSLAFGSEFRRSIESVYDVVDRRSSKVSARALDAVRRADESAIRSALLKPRIDEDVVRALAKSRDRRVAELLVDMLRTSATPKHARHAISFALSRMLQLTSPPIDPDQGKPLDAERERMLRRRIARDLI